MRISETPIKYRLDLSKTKQREIDVEMEVDLPGQKSLDVVMPHISPGSPTNSLNHDRRIRNVRVTDAQGDNLQFKKLKSGGFRIPANGPVTVHYTVRADHFSHVRNDLTDDHAYINGPAAMMYVKGRDTDVPSTVELTQVPNSDWKAAASLPEMKGIPYAFYATSFQDIADTNIFLGEMKSAGEVVNGTELQVNVHGTPPWKNLRVNGATAEESLSDLKALFKVFTKNFGQFPLERRRDAEPRPEGVSQTDKYVLNKHYFHNGPRSAGGYEHYHGHELLLHKVSEAGIEKKYNSDGRAFERGIIGHELMHKLLAKFVTHDGIDSEDLSSAGKTDGLWVTEGITDWAGVILERQSGLMSSQEYLEHLEGFYQRYLDDISHNMTSPTDDSLDAHIGNSNYYNKGAVAGSLLDLEMRHYSGGERGMFDVLRSLKEEFGGTGQGHTLDDMERLCLEQVKDSPEGAARISEFFEKNLRGREPMDINGALAHVGYELREEVETTDPASLTMFDNSTLRVESDGDLHLVKCSHEHPHSHDHVHDHGPTKAYLPTLGVKIESNGDKWKLSSVSWDGPAGQAGLASFQGQTAKELSFDEDTRQMKFVFDQEDMFSGEMETQEVFVPEGQATVFKMTEAAQPSQEQRTLRDAWLQAFAS